MLTKNTPAPARRIKAGPEDGLKEGEFIVYPSTFTKQPDAYGDVVAPGAFLKNIATWKNSGDTMPGLFGHRMDDPDFYVASALDMGEDEHGWWVKGVFDLDSPKGTQVYRLVKGRRLNQLSFAYDVVDQAGVELDNGVKANELRELKVHEFSFVPVGANQDTSVVAVKSILETVAADMKAGRTLSAKNEDAIRGALTQAEEIVNSLKSVLPDNSSADEEDQEMTSGKESSCDDTKSSSDATTPSPSVLLALAEIHIAEGDI